ncbi:MAG: hypothetical protein IPN77_18870 [Sandaracinaceae bacterium]|nr:hypothetical protein [Sandaracinaceae bacterium]
MRLLTPLLDRHATSKNISTMRAWLARAGPLPTQGLRRVDLGALERLLGEDTSPLFGLSEGEAEFVLAVRLVEEQTGESWVRASAAKTVALQRNPDAAIPHKALSGFVKKLSIEGVCEVGSAGGSGGSGTTVRLIAAGRDFTDGELRNLLAQSQSGFGTPQRCSRSGSVPAAESDDIHVCGHAGEMMAVHPVAALGLRVEAWRAGAGGEIDLNCRAHSGPRLPALDGAG